MGMDEDNWPLAYGNLPLPAMLGVKSEMLAKNYPSWVCGPIAPEASGSRGQQFPEIAYRLLKAVSQRDLRFPA
jgi:hypothetical protein